MHQQPVGFVPHEHGIHRRVQHSDRRLPRSYRYTMRDVGCGGYMYGGSGFYADSGNGFYVYGGIGYYNYW
jgi:hypothetical protein